MYVELYFTHMLRVMRHTCGTGTSNMAAWLVTCVYVSCRGSYRKKTVSFDMMSAVMGR